MFVFSFPLIDLIKAHRAYRELPVTRPEETFRRFVYQAHTHANTLSLKLSVLSLKGYSTIFFQNFWIIGLGRSKQSCRVFWEKKEKKEFGSKIEWKFTSADVFTTFVTSSSSLSEVMCSFWDLRYLTKTTRTIRTIKVWPVQIILFSWRFTGLLDTTGTGQHSLK